MYCRIEMTTTQDVVFMSPYVFTMVEGIKKMSQMGWLEETRKPKMGSLRLVEVKGAWPREVLWNPDWSKDSGERCRKRIGKAERAWEAFTLGGEEEED